MVAETEQIANRGNFPFEMLVKAAHLAGRTVEEAFGFLVRGSSS